MGRHRCAAKKQLAAGNWQIARPDSAKVQGAMAGRKAGSAQAMAPAVHERSGATGRGVPVTQKGQKPKAKSRLLIAVNKTDSPGISEISTLTESSRSG